MKSQDVQRTSKKKKKLTQKSYVREHTSKFKIYKSNAKLSYIQIYLSQLYNPAHLNTHALENTQKTSKKLLSYFSHVPPLRSSNAFGGLWSTYSAPVPPRAARRWPCAAPWPGVL